MKKILILLFFISINIFPVFAFGSDISVMKDSGIYIFKIPLAKYGEKIKPYVAEELTTVSDVFNDEDLNFKFVVNGGFFDPKNGAPVSNVKIDGIEVQSLFQNLPVVESLEKQKRVEAVLNRAELRILEDKNKNLTFKIANHLEKVSPNLKIKHSIQAGPMILPELKLEEESFIKTLEDGSTKLYAADVLKRRERTIIGLKKDSLLRDYLYVLIFTKDHKIALNEAKDYCIALGLTSAMAFDGGASTSVNYKDIEVYSASDGQRRVKSFLVIEDEKKPKSKEIDEAVLNEDPDIENKDEQ